MANENQSCFFFVSEASFFIRLLVQNSLCLCLPEQFEPVVSALSACEISQQQALSYIPTWEFYWHIVSMPLS